MAEVVEIPAPATPGKFRFSVADDVAVLRELTTYQNPFRHGSKVWDEMQKRLPARFHTLKARTLRERVVHLCKLHMKGEATSMKQSGTAEEYTEKDQLLDGVVELFKGDLEEKATTADTKKKNEKKIEDDRELGLKIREDAAATLSEKKTPKKTSTEPSPKRKYEPTSLRERRSDVLDKMSKQMEEIRDMKKKELDVRQQEIDLRKEELAFQRQQAQTMYRKE
eukprot:scpid101682/ scgid30391/ 